MDKEKLNEKIVQSLCREYQAVWIVNLDEYSAEVFVSNSEIVIPLIYDNKRFGVLDIDSTSLARFTEEDKVGLEIVAKRIEQIRRGVQNL